MLPRVLLALSLAACSRSVQPEECAQMLDRYVTMTAPADSPQQKALPAAYKKAQEQCSREVTRKEYACAMDAKSPNDWEACIE
jgi:hypothetical protein